MSPPISSWTHCWTSSETRVTLMWPLGFESNFSDSQTIPRNSTFIGIWSWQVRQESFQVYNKHKVCDPHVSDQSYTLPYSSSRSKTPKLWYTAVLKGRRLWYQSNENCTRYHNLCYINPPDLCSTRTLNVLATPFKPETQYCSRTVTRRGLFVSTTCSSSLWGLISNFVNRKVILFNPYPSSSPSTSTIGVGGGEFRLTTWCSSVALLYSIFYIFMIAPKEYILA